MCGFACFLVYLFSIIWSGVAEFYSAFRANIFVGEYHLVLKLITIVTRSKFIPVVFFCHISLAQKYHPPKFACYGRYAINELKL